MFFIFFCRKSAVKIGAKFHNCTRASLIRSGFKTKGASTFYRIFFNLRKFTAVVRNEPLGWDHHHSIPFFLLFYICFSPARSPITKQRSTKIKQGNFRKFISAQNKGISMAFFGPGRSIRLTNYYRLYWNSVITFSVKKWYQNRYRNWISVGINGHLSGEIRRPFGALGFYATVSLAADILGWVKLN